MSKRKLQVGSRVVIDLEVDQDLFLPSTFDFKKGGVTRGKGVGKRKANKWKRHKQIISGENYQDLPVDEPTYASIEAAPSMYPKKKYCDLTGFEALYTDPKTKLRYRDAAAFAQARDLVPEQVQARLSVRGAAVVLR